MKKIVMCVPTYNHPEAVEDVLSQCVQDYYDLDVDIFYFDGSEGSETEEIVEKYKSLGFDNLYYYHGDVAGVERTTRMRMGIGFEHDYEYFWPCKDRSYCDRETLVQIVEAVNKNYDVIFLGSINACNMENTTYTNPVDFYRDWGWLATSIDVTILRRSTMLNDYRGDRYPRIFGTHYMLLYTKLAELDKCTIRVLCNNSHICSSLLAQSGWTKNIFKVWKEDWIFANEFLPECYNSFKDSTIRNAAGLPWVLGTKERLIELHDAGILVPEVLGEVKPNWERISNIPFETVKDIAYGIYDINHDLGNLPYTDNELFELLKRLTSMAQSKVIQNNQVPYDDLRIALTGELKNKLRLCNTDVKALTIGAMQDLCDFGTHYDLNQAECAKLLHSITMFMYIILTK